MTTTEALARGLFDLDCHDWGGPCTDEAFESLRLHYVRDVERFLLPRLAAMSEQEASE